jgi:soluble lytic murein transglycosylase-like protein
MILEILSLAGLLAAYRSKKEKEINNLPLTNKENIKKYIYQQTSKAGLNPIISVRQAIQESGLRPNVTSSAGAQGVFQFMPGTWKMYGKGSPFNVKDSVEAYIKYMRKLRNDFPGRTDLQLAGYNWGENRKVLKEAFSKNLTFSQYSGALPEETRNYVRKIYFN